ncbi:hypothetical protein BOTNAR_0045g00360 [Botryotinia narcissicola]|uniref:Altered inheritance of mitochondria protein 6 n=1 Tax=Botryotinia narcissicola TaxID=278944 RepID=A0A4Z1J6V0_9HELO|nr:hypothetical protein BOTNAR_0045g00360 [Botryotinia narcissicola]
MTYSQPGMQSCQVLIIVRELTSSDSTEDHQSEISSASTVSTFEYGSDTSCSTVQSKRTARRRVCIQTERGNIIIHRKWLFISAFLFVVGILPVLIWLSLALTLARPTTPRFLLNRASTIINDWTAPKDSLNLLSPWDPDFTQGIIPIPCHSHNDYMRAVPLFEALAAGCTSIEADIHLSTQAESRDLLVGHNTNSLTQERTLQSLYIGPLLEILENINERITVSNDTVKDWNGVFQSRPSTTLTLLLEFKSDGIELWPHVIQQLESLRIKGWLTYWDSSSGIHWAPIIIVASGNAHFDVLKANTTYRDIFYDAPLTDISNPIYNITNSYYASTSITKALGTQWPWRFSSAQLHRISSQITAANEKGLKARYWNTPAWPITFQDYITGV